MCQTKAIGHMLFSFGEIRSVWTLQCCVARISILSTYSRVGEGGWGSQIRCESCRGKKCRFWNVLWWKHDKTIWCEVFHVAKENFNDSGLLSFSLHMAFCVLDNVHFEFGWVTHSPTSIPQKDWGVWLVLLAPRRIGVCDWCYWPPEGLGCVTDCVSDLQKELGCVTLWLTVKSRV